MNTAIIYATKHGCTDKCAHTLANNIGQPTQLFNVELNDKISIEKFDTVILGGSIHAGSINKSLKTFIEKETVQLLTKKLGLFICCMYSGEPALEQFQQAFPQELRDKAIAHGLFGGEIVLDKMNIMEKAIIKKVANIDKNVSLIDYPSIKSFAENF